MRTGVNVHVHEPQTVTKIRKIPHNRPDLVVWNNDSKQCKIIDVSIALDTNVKLRKQTKHDNYIGLINQLQRVYRTYTCIHTYIHTYIHTWLFSHGGREKYPPAALNWVLVVPNLIHIYIHTYIHMYIHTYMHTYIHTYMHACMHGYIVSTLVSYLACSYTITEGAL